MTNCIVLVFVLRWFTDINKLTEVSHSHVFESKMKVEVWTCFLWGIHWKFFCNNIVYETLDC